jgi:hypothetical protein
VYTYVGRAETEVPQARERLQRIESGDEGQFERFELDTAQVSTPGLTQSRGRGFEKYLPNLSSTCSVIRHDCSMLQEH